MASVALLGAGVIIGFVAAVVSGAVMNLRDVKLRDSELSHK